MQIIKGRLAAKAVGLVAAVTGVAALTTAPAHAETIVWLSNPSHCAGVYKSWQIDMGKTGVPDLCPGPNDHKDAIIAYCWVRGDDIDNGGNVWYYTERVYYSWEGWQYHSGYLYGDYVDSNKEFHAGLQHCGWGN
ncbi:hypothetical protein ACFYZJ_30435 [Streptomyces sp. NPDC001848]|uniref:hypothetical protein n=1 Tax=Streptomyces sp. NPDC001848 TaxID=3364618 RepID=UPI00369AC571